LERTKMQFVVKKEIEYILIDSRFR
jgi:hypothetical protein